MPTSSYQEMLDEFDPIGSRSSTPIASAPAPSSGIRASLHAVQPAAAPATATDRPFDVGAAPGSRDSPEEARGLGRTSGGGRGLGDEPSGNDLIGEYTMSSLLATGSERSHAGRGTGKAPLSPPRRMASLMDLVPPPSSNVQYHSTKAMSIPQLSSPSLDDFHPSSPPSTSSAVDSFDDYFFKSSLFTGQDQDEIDPATNLSASPDWSEFQTADAGGFSSSPPLPELPSPRSRLSPRALSDSIASGLGHKTRRAPKAPPPAPDTTWKEEWTYDAKGADAVQPIVLKGVSPGLERALQEDIAEGIRPNLPARLRISTRWKLLYSLDQHGTSLKTMYECMEEVLGELDGGCVLVVKDTRGAIFGAYINEGLREQRSYYGDGSCFLWKATPFGPADFRVGHSVKSFKWTGRNEYYILTDSRSISVGGGDGRFGLWIDGVFEKGYSSRCPCFGNDPLVERYAKGPSGVDEAEFDVLSFEIWSVGG